jgi:phosphatidylglycerol---prolipoprotein diacylglyceryl transferase
MNPVIFQLGPFSLHWYGVLIVGGAVLAAWLASRSAERNGDNPDHLWNLLAWSLVVGIIGARLYHVFSTPANGVGWDYYRANPGEIFNFWNGGFRGLGIYGGLVGGIIAIFGYCWFNKLDPIKYLDYLAPNVLIAQAVGRLGNFVNQELYGPPTDLPWAFHINPAFPCQPPTDLPANIQLCGTGALVPFSQETLNWYASNGFHPTFFYESLWNLVMWGLLTFIFWRFGERFRRGDAILAYFIAYPLGRFWVESFRPDAWVAGGLPTAQWIALGSIAVSIVIFIIRRRGWDWKTADDTLVYLSSKARPPAAKNTKTGAAAAT